MDLAYAFADRFAAHDTEGFVALFADGSPLLQLGHQSIGKDAIRYWAEMYYELGQEVNISDCRQESDAVICAAARWDECFPPDLEAMRSTVTFTFESGKIMKVNSDRNAEDYTRYLEYDGERDAWARKNRAGDMATMEASSNWSGSELGQFWRRICTEYKTHRQTAQPVSATPTVTPRPPASNTPPTPGKPLTAAELAAAFAERFNTRDVEGFTALFAAQPSVDLWIAQNTLDGLRWDVAFASEYGLTLEVTDCETVGETATCMVAVRNECIPPELAPLHYRAIFLALGGKIQSILSTVDASEMQTYQKYAAERLDWALANAGEDGQKYSEWIAGSKDFSAVEYGQAVHRVCTGYEGSAAATPSASLAATPVATGELQLTILYDNTATDPQLTKGWGFAALVAHDGHIVLFDTGESGQSLLRNMERLGVDPRSIEAVVLSHAHDDHTAGLWALLDSGVRPTVYAPAAFVDSFKKRVREWTELVEVSEPLTIFPGMHVTRPIGSIIEQALVVETLDGTVVITGCAHPGIVEMVRQAQGLVPGKVALLAGGFHLLETGSDQVKSIIAELEQMGVESVMPAHCTGDAAMDLFRAEYGESYVDGGVGCTWDSAK
jgi:7,8-dihydropterin-6-yl-methyl-4-(beta-D-ribofuranosyl)aminobenzene 5'-phosphate synthase